MDDVKIDDDVSLMLEFKEGNESYFEKLLDKYESPIINFIFRFTGSRDEAEDLAQEVFLRIYKNAQKYEPKAKFATWIYKIATNVCLDYKRKISNDLLKRSEPLLTQNEDGEQREKEIRDPSEKPLEISVEQRQTNNSIQALLCLLPENQRIALTLKTYEDKPYDEIAEILSCSVPAVESLIFRARKALKDKLTKTGMFGVLDKKF